LLTILSAPAKLHSSGDLEKGVMFKIDFEKAYDKVRWDFVEESLVKKGFPPIWIKQAMSIVWGGRVCVNVNRGKDSIF
jgi:hypothetical protein